MISLSDAIKIILAARPKRETGEVGLVDSLGFTCAKDIVARLTQPPFSASAMDGYAVRFGDGLSKGDSLQVIGEAPAGAPFEGEVQAGQAVRLFTGSVIPDGADHVIIQENVSRDDDAITLTADQPVARNIRKAGVDFAEGDVLVRSGEIMTPARIALAAASNHGLVAVLKPLTIALLANGDELIAPGNPISKGEIISSNQAALGALFQSWGMTVMDLGIAKDDPADIAAKIETAKDADIIIPIGGASVGDHDHMRSVFKEAGFETLFEKAAVRPGKPTWFARRGNQYVLGLPGNPASAYVCAHIFGPLLLGLSGEIKTVSLPASEPMKANGPRYHFQRARLFIDQDSRAKVQPFSRTDSSLITPLAEANALIVLPPDSGPWEAGDKVEVMTLGTGPAFI